LAALLGLVAATALDAAAADLQLVWNDNTADEDGFELERQEPDSGNYTRIARLASNTTAFTDADLAPETTYCYRIRAFNAAGESLYSQSACAKTVTAVADSNGPGRNDEVNEVTHGADPRSQLIAQLPPQPEVDEVEGAVTQRWMRTAFTGTFLPRRPQSGNSHPRAGEVLHPLTPPRTLFMHGILPLKD